MNFPRLRFGEGELAVLEIEFSEEGSGVVAGDAVFLEERFDLGGEIDGFWGVVRRTSAADKGDGEEEGSEDAKRIQDHEVISGRKRLGTRRDLGSRDFEGEWEASTTIGVPGS